jgi:hypothetical protein
VQHLAVVVAGVGGRGEAGADPELLQDDRPAGEGGQLTGERRGQVQADPVGVHRVDVGADEVDQWSGGPQRIAVVDPGQLDPPGAVAQRQRLGAAAGPDGLDQQLGPGRDHRLGGRPAVEGHLVGQQPAGHRRVAGEPPGDLAHVPGLAGHHPDVAVQVAALAPGRVPVLPRHVPDQEGRDRRQPGLGMAVQEVGEAGQHLLVEPVGLGLEVGPEAERPGEVQAGGGQGGQLLGDHRGVVVAPHPRPPGPRPVVDPQPGPPPDQQLAPHLRSPCY